MTHAEIAQSYDEVPYPSVPKPETYPGRLEVLAKLFGMNPAPIEHCRVLELGCADGGNIIPLAESFPHSEFTGIDLGLQQLSNGQRLAQTLGLNNISLRHGNILDAGPELGQFDYIITYGIFSWVPREVQDKILELSSRNLAPHGIAYISYNTYPGWRMREGLRDLMLYHTRDMESEGLRARAQESRSILAFVREAVAELSGSLKTTLDLNAYALALKREQELLTDRPDVYLVHEFLERYNEPIYFHEFASRAGGHGLQYLAEAEYSLMHTINFPTHIATALQQLGRDIVETEQYMDFVRNRTFRQTLLCHADIALNRDLKPETLYGFHISSNVQSVSDEVDLHSDAVERFRGRNGAILTVSNPMGKAAMLCLSESWPAAIPFNALVDRSRLRLDSNSSPVQSSDTRTRDTRALGEMLLRCLTLDLIELHMRPINYAVEAGALPSTTPLARLQSRAGRKVTSLRHEQVTLDDEVSYQVLRSLDGRQDRRALLEMLMERVADGTLTVQAKGEPITDRAEMIRYLDAALNQNLERLARAALLVN